MNFEFLGKCCRPRSTTVNVAKRFPKLLLLAERVHVLTLACPCDTAKQHGADTIVREILIPMAGDMNKGAVGFPTAVHGPFVGPNLGLDVVDVDHVRLRSRLTIRAGANGFGRVGRSEHRDFRKEIHVIVDLVLKVEVGNAPSDRILAVSEVEAHRAF